MENDLKPASPTIGTTPPRNPFGMGKAFASLASEITKLGGVR